MLMVSLHTKSLD
uniref:Uncharacterized protein n=1 Tax=Anguilla anguilla TaxID=7936 RepID=A0A0E9Q0C6_ANGAN